LAWFVLGAELPALLPELVVLVWTIPVPLMTWPIVCVGPPLELAELGVAPGVEVVLALVLVELEDGAAASAVRALADLA
jgi:hypothetical protein